MMHSSGSGKLSPSLLATPLSWLLPPCPFLPLARRPVVGSAWGAHNPCRGVWWGMRGWCTGYPWACRSGQAGLAGAACPRDQLGDQPHFMESNRGSTCYHILIQSLTKSINIDHIKKVTVNSIFQPLICTLVWFFLKLQDRITNTLSVKTRQKKFDETGKLDKFWPLIDVEAGLISKIHN